MIATQHLYNLASLMLRVDRGGVHDVDLLRGEARAVAVEQLVVHFVRHLRGHATRHAVVEQVGNDVNDAVIEVSAEQGSR